MTETGEPEEMSGRLADPSRPLFALDRTAAGRSERGRARVDGGRHRGLAHSAIVDPLTVGLALLAALVLGVQARIVKLASNEPASA